MEVASLELCKELYELSGWRDTSTRYDYGNMAGWYTTTTKHLVEGNDVTLPAYDLGYVMRKLPSGIHIFKASKSVRNDGVVKYSAWMQNVTRYRLLATTPEDAACELAIELFKSGVLSSSDGRRAD